MSLRARIMAAERRTGPAGAPSAEEMLAARQRLTEAAREHLAASVRASRAGRPPPPLPAETEQERRDREVCAWFDAVHGVVYDYAALREEFNRRLERLVAAN